MNQLIKFMSLPANFQYVASSPDSATKQKRIAELHKKFQSQSNFAAVANFSAEISDFGSPEGIYECDFATFNTLAKEKAAFDDLKIIVAKHNVRDSIRQYILQSNSVRAANRAKQKQKEEQKKNKHVSHPNWY